MELDILQNTLNTFEPQTSDEKFILMACVEAYKAYQDGNFGIGAILVNEQGEVVEKGHNSVFNPTFRSDLHAEMVVMNQFEERNKEKKDLSKYTIYTSLEPCPMCLSRLITSGVGNVKFATLDHDGGMVSRWSSLPPIWKEISKNRNYGKADISEELEKIARDIFLSNVEELDNSLKK